jgi:hypothetical protein
MSQNGGILSQPNFWSLHIDKIYQVRWDYPFSHTSPSHSAWRSSKGLSGSQQTFLLTNWLLYQTYVSHWPETQFQALPVQRTSHLLLSLKWTMENCTTYNYHWANYQLVSRFNRSAWRFIVHLQLYWSLLLVPKLTRKCWAPRFDLRCLSMLQRYWSRPRWTSY